MAQALYRKYRSRSLDELVGQEHVTKTLANALKEGRISHAYLLTGPRGTGKTSIARILAHEINKIPYEGESTHLDIIEIDAASNNGVEDVRDLREKVMLAPTSAAYKVYIIDEVHMLSNAAFNALLKTLEEPPAHVLFILATTEVHKLPATIISRTQRFQLQPIPRQKVVAHLQHIAKQEGITVSDEALGLIADHGDGAFRDSISLLDQLRSVSQEGITPETVETTLGLAPRAELEQLITALLAGEVSSAISHYEQLLGKGIAAPALAAQLIHILRVLAPKQPVLYDLIDKLIEVPRAYNPQLKMEVVLATFALRASPDAAPTPPAGNAPVTATPKAPSPAPPKPPVAAKKEALKPTSAAPIATETAPESMPASQPEAIETVTETPSPTSVAAHTPGEPLPELSDELWNSILDNAKGAGPTLYTLLRQAIPHFDTEKQLLTMTFRFPLHQKRLDEQRYKQEFAKLLQATWGAVPEMQLIVNKNAIKHIKPAAPAAQGVEDVVQSDPAASNVLGLMGGGEIVNV